MRINKETNGMRKNERESNEYEKRIIKHQREKIERNSFYCKHIDHFYSFSEGGCSLG